MAERRWSQMSPQELLDRAEQAMAGAEFERSTYQTRLNEATLLLQAAQVAATENLTWTLQNRTSIGLPEWTGDEPPPL